MQRRRWRSPVATEGQDRIDSIGCISASLPPLTPRLFEVDPRTIARWQVFWRDNFPQTPFWKVASGQLALLGELLDLPRALLTAFFRDDEADPREKWKKLLVFLSPITITGGLKSKVSS